MTGETIVLPKSGVVLRRSSGMDGMFAYSAGVEVCSVALGFYPHCYGPEKWNANVGDDYFCATTCDPCIAWVDARVLELRAALLPPGAIVLVPGEALRATVAAALRDVRRRGDRVCPPTSEQWRDADAIVAAITKGATHG